MFLQGALALVQMVFLPGLLITFYFNLNDGLVRTGLLSFALSLITNYILVALLTLLHLYNFTALLVLFVIEMLLLIRFIFGYGETAFKNKVHFRQSCALIAEQSAPKILLTGLALFSIVSIVWIYINSPIHALFSVPDGILRWNTWATLWSQGHFPTDTWNYPQLLPTNWSISYVFMGSPFVQLFSKFTIFLFPAGILFALWDLFLRTKKFSYVAAMIATTFISHLVLNHRAFEGYADVACAFFALMAFYWVIQARYETQHTVRNLFLGAVMAGAAACTKQSGLYIAAIYPVLMYLFVFRAETSLDSKQKIKALSISCFTLLILILPTYAFTHTPPAVLPLDPNDIVLSADPYYTLAFWQRGLFGIRYLHSMLGFSPWLILSAGIIVALSSLYSLFIDATARKLTLLIVVPYFLIWLFTVSYDPRNLAFVIPFAGIVVGVTLTKFFERLGSKRAWILFAAIVGTGALSLILFSKPIDNALIKKQTQLKLYYIGSYLTNKVIYKHIKNNQATVMSNYIYLDREPLFEKRATFEQFIDIPGMVKHIQQIKPDYLIVHKYVLTYYLSKIVLNHRKDFIPEKTAMNFIYHEKPIDEKKMNVYIKNKILKQSYVQQHYKLVYKDKNMVIMRKK